jgi:hypothetical protein
MIAIKKQFLHANGDNPSGKTVDDLVAFIWAECWKHHSFEIGKKNKRKQSSHKDDQQDDEQDDDDDDIEEKHEDHQSIYNSNELLKIPDDFTSPELLFNGKWMPNGWAVLLLTFVAIQGAVMIWSISMLAMDYGLTTPKQRQEAEREREKMRK